MTINPLYPIVTRGHWIAPPDSTLRVTLADKISELVDQGKTDGILTRVDIDPTSYYAYRYWADIEAAQDWIDYCVIIPAAEMTSISIVDASEVADI